MARGEYRNWGVTQSGDIIPSTQIEVRLTSDNTLATLYTTADGADTIDNPFSAGADGSFSFFADPNMYNVLVGSGASQQRLPINILESQFDIERNIQVTLEQFGATGGADDTAAWNAANDYLEGIGGGEIQLRRNRTYTLMNTTVASRITVRGNGKYNGGLAVHAGATVTDTWMENRTVSNTATRDDSGIRFLDMDIDATNWPTIRWLSRSDGTPVTDPEADYVMETGALASGITGTSLTAVLTGDAVTSVTINNGGAGWNGHPTFPYIPPAVPPNPNTVLIRFEGGGGSGAQATATISGGTITSITVDEGGSGYVSAPTATAQGGYADIALLSDPSVNRRNAGYNSVGSLLFFRKVNSPEVRNVRFVGARRRVLGDAGCLDAKFTDLTFENCGKNDGPFHCIWAQSHGNPAAPTSGFMDTENVLVENVSVNGAERSAILFTPTRGGILRNLRANACGESTVFINENLNVNGGRAIIEDCHLSNNTITDIVGQLIEGGEVRNLTVRNNLLEGSAEDAVHFLGGTNVLVEGNTFRNNVTASSTLPGRLPYGPFSERQAFGSGTQPIAGEELSISNFPVSRIGTIAGNGANGVTYRNNFFEEDRAEFPPFIFRLFRTGGTFLSQDITIADNNLVNVPQGVSGMGLIDTSVDNVMLATMPLHIKGNLGHASEAPVRLDYSVASGTSGPQPFDVGFRPSLIEVFATTDDPLEFLVSNGRIVWRRDQTERTDFVLTSSTDGSVSRSRFFNSDVARIFAATGGATILSVEFVAWQETGFSINVITATSDATVRFICHP